MKCMRSIAFTGMKGRKKETFTLIAVMFLTFFFLMTTVTLQGSFLKTSEAERFEIYGKWMGAVWNASPQDKSELEKIWLTEHVGEMRVFGEMQASGGNTAGTLGAIDKEALKFCGLKLKEGRLPENKNEIALEASALGKLKLPLEIGETVRFRLEGEKEYSFTLCGIIKPQSEQWETDGTVLPKGYTDMSFGDRGTACHFLFDGPDVNVLTSHEKMIQELLKDPSGSSLTFNPRAWAPENYSLESMLKGSMILIIILCISICVVLYILTSSMKNRKYRIVLLKSMGASTGQLCGLVTWESIFMWLFSAPAGIAAGILIPAGGMTIYNKTAVTPIQIGLDPELTAFAVLSATAVVLIGDVYLMLSIGKIPVVPSFENNSSLLSRKRLPKKLMNERMSAFRMMLRFRSFHWGQKIFRMGLSVVAAVLILGATVLAGKSMSDYHLFSKLAAFDYEWSAPTPQDGLSKADVEKIRNTKGVERVFCYRSLSVDWEDKFRVSWKGSAGNPYVEKACEFEGNAVEKPEDALGSMEMIGIPGEYREMLKPYERAVEDGTFDEEAFFKGEEVFVYLPPFAVKNLENAVSLIPQPDDYDPEKLYEDKTLKQGDMIKITTPYGSREVKVGGVLRSVEQDASTGGQYSYMALGTIVASDVFTASFFKEEPSEKYSRVAAVVDSSADYETTDKELTGLKAGPKVDFQNGREANLEFRGRMITKTALAMIFGTAIFLLYCMIMFTGQTARMQEDEERSKILRVLGMTRKKLSSIYLWETLLECAWSLFIGGATVFISFAFYEYHNGISITLSGLLKEAGSDFPLIWFAVMCGVFALAYILAGYAPVRKMMRE